MASSDSGLQVFFTLVGAFAPSLIILKISSLFDMNDLRKALGEMRRRPARRVLVELGFLGLMRPHDWVSGPALAAVGNGFIVAFLATSPASMSGGAAGSYLLCYIIGVVSWAVCFGEWSSLSAIQTAMPSPPRLTPAQLRGTVGRRLNYRYMALKCSVNRRGVLCLFAGAIWAAIGMVVPLVLES